jgi:Cys-tRNA(Pro) deacylase
MNKPRSALELDHKGIPYQLVPHPNSAHTAEDAAMELGYDVSRIVKSLLAEGHRHPPVLLLVPGDRRIHFGKLGKILGDTSVFLCSPERTLAVTGYPVGIVTAFGLKSPLPVYMEEDILGRGTVALSSGDWGFELLLTDQDVLKATGATIGAFSRENKIA